jgi:hypothetical protein
MDAIHLHWNEWGFPGKDMLHMHSTPLQIAFDRGLPMLGLWLWLMIAFWINVSRSAKVASDLSDTTSYGILVGILGALTGFLASSLVNYNYGDSEVAMMFWWLMESQWRCKANWQVKREDPGFDHDDTMATSCPASSWPNVKS